MTPLAGSTQTISYARYTSNQTVGFASLAKPGLHCEVTPNPARDQVRISFNLETSTQVLVRLTDITGRLAASLPATEMKAGENRLSLPTSGLPASVYMLHVNAGDAVTTMKVIIG